MTSRLDRLFVLLETGSSAVTRRAAAQQLGEAQRLHPHELHHLLARVSALLKSPQWDTRVAAAHAIQAILAQVPQWDPKPLKIDSPDGQLQQEDNKDALTRQSSKANRLSLRDFDMGRVLARSSHLTGSEGTEYDLVVAEASEQPNPRQTEKIVAAKLGFHPQLMGIDTNELFTNEDLAPSTQATFVSQSKTPIDETMCQTGGLSRREMNRARRKARQSISKQRSKEPDEPQDYQISVTSASGEPLIKKPKQDESSMSEASWSGEEGGGLGVPDGTGCWPDSAIEWPLESFSEILCQDLFSQKWEIRHGAATALRELVRLHGKGAGKSRDQTKEEMDESHRQWVEDAALRLLCVLGLDRFGDFVSDQVVAPVRETCAQALGSLLLLMPCTDNSQENNGKAENNKEEEEEQQQKQTIMEKEETEKRDCEKIKEGGALGVLAVILKLLKHNEWEARHGALLALKYLLAVREDLLDELLPRAFPAAMSGLADPVDDVGAAAASALIPIAGVLPRLLTPPQLEAVVLRLWELLREQDDLAAACNSFMGLLAAILSLPAAREHLTPQPLSRVLPRLWPFLGHSSSSVRKATLQTLLTLTGDEGDSKGDQERWGDTGGGVLQEALRQVFQRALVEHVANIQEMAERVWQNLVVRSDLELLLHASCPLVSTWLCLAMQPEHVPFSSSLLVTATTTQHNSRSVAKVCSGGGGGSNASDAQSDSGSNGGCSSGGSKSSSELKVYIGGVETVAPGTRRANVVRARCMAARMLGLLSCYVVRPAPGVIYTADIPSPGLCYAKVLLVHLASRSALQRTVAGLTMAHWATLEHPNPPSIPDILREKLLGCLNECVYYDEIAVTFTRLLQETRDYVATLKHYKLPLHEGTGLDVAGVTTGVMTLEQIIMFTGKTVSNLLGVVAGSGTGGGGGGGGSNAAVKLKPKVLDSLEERRRAIEIGATATAMQQHALNVTSMAALAGAATMLRCLPTPDSPLNPLIKPLMESAKREENDQLQSLAAQHLAHLIDLCVDRQPSPNNKIATNLCTFLCSDSEFTPKVVGDSQPFEGILTLVNRQRHAERVAYNRGSFGGNGGRGPGRPPTTEIPLEELLACEEPEAKAARTRRRGATLALSAVTKLLGDRLSRRLPRLWDLMLPPVLQNCTNDEYSYWQNRQDEASQLVSSLQVLETVFPSLHSTLHPPVLLCLPRLCNLLKHPYKAVRHMAARCIAVLAVLHTDQVMSHVLSRVIPLLEPSGGKESSAGEKVEIIAVAEIDAKRQGAAEALACLVDNLGVGVVPYAVLLVVPLLGRMSDQNQAVRLTCSATFATLVQLMPLDPGAIGDSPSLGEEKSQERHFLEQLLNPRSIPDTKLPVSVSAELRAYQHQGLNWLAFLNRYRLHGVLCDDMGLGKTLQTLCMLATDHYQHPHTSPSLVVCPPTLTGHWVYEAEKFFKPNDLSALQYAGPPQEREKLRPRVNRYRLVVASYDIVRKDIEFFEAIQWNYCVLDEGHVIKNGKTKSAKAAKRLRAHHRLILSGTPVQNDVLELWSLFDFLMPGFLGSEKQFAARYSRPILASREPKAGAKDQEAGALAMEALHRQVLPFLLRRNKEDVLQDLPPKITQDYYCELSPLQRTLYEDFRTRHSASLGSSAPANNPLGTHVFQALRYLRNVCNHPKLVLTLRHPQYQSICASLKHQQSSLTDIEHGAKLPALKQLLLDCGIGQQQQHPTLMTPINSTDSQQQQLVSQHRALIFCQLKAMLDIVEKDLLRVHLPTVTYLRLDGSVPASQRHSVVARFNADPSIDVLLLTTQVGGLGLNLTGADTVIFVEHDWNPMKDLQAMDRAHRIGQKKVVNVYRLITRGTLEEKIMGLQKFKLLTANTVISTDNASMETMGTDQLLDLFSLDKNKEKRSDGHGSSGGGGGGGMDGNDSGFTGIAGIGRSLLESLPELWEQQQYDDEYDLDSFLSTLRGDNQQSAI